MSGPDAAGYDPAQHDSQLVAVFEDRRLADGARDALLGAGIPPDAIELTDHGQAADAPAPGFWAALTRLFAPEDEAHDLGKALDRGHVIVAVHPASAAERETAIEVLEGHGPLDVDERRADWDMEATVAHQPIAIVPDVDEPTREHLVRIVEERMRVGWRDRATGGKVRSYVAPRPTAAHRVELEEDEIGEGPRS